MSAPAVSDGSAPVAAQLPKLEIIYENAELLVVSKPPDVPMDGSLDVYASTVESMVYDHMRRRGIYDEAHEQLQQQGKRKKQLKFVHQLDYSTSGVLCLAYAKDMAARLAHCFEMRTTRKYYLALLHGHIPDHSPATRDSGEEQAAIAPCASHFEQWASQWNETWHDIGSVRVDACARFSAEQNAAALDEFLFLLDDHHSSGDRSTVLGVSTASETPSLPTVHRHCVERTVTTETLEGSPSTPSLPPQPACHSASGVHALLREVSRSAAPASLTIDLPIGYDTTDPEHFRMAATAEQSRSASTSLLVLRRTHLTPTAADGAAPVTLVLLSPHTGRRHQLRVHCRAVGFPIVGDAAYAAELPWCRSVAGNEVDASVWRRTPACRMYLHAWRLVLPGAVTSHVDESVRVALKKKRRRETLGLSERGDAAVSADDNVWTEFVAPVHFASVVNDA